MSEANKTQVGGDHYKGGYEPWDFSEDIQCGTLESAAIKYIYRWRTKDGLKDLKKAHHYICKLYELAIEGTRRARSSLDRAFIEEFTGKMNVHTPVEKEMVTILASWDQPVDVLRAGFLLDGLIEAASKAKENG